MLDLSFNLTSPSSFFRNDLIVDLFGAHREEAFSAEACYDL